MAKEPLYLIFESLYNLRETPHPRSLWLSFRREKGKLGAWFVRGRSLLDYFSWLFHLFSFFFPFNILPFLYVVEFLKGYKWVVHFSILSMQNCGKKVRGVFTNPWGLCVFAMHRALIFMLWNVVYFFRICLRQCIQDFFVCYFLFWMPNLGSLNPKSQESI